MIELLGWYLASTALGLASLPTAALVFRWLPDRGWSLARPFGLLLVGWLVWLPLVVTHWPFTRGWIIGTIVCWLLFNGALLASRRELLDALRGVLARGWRHAVAGEVIFAGAYALMAWEHSFTAAVSGTEKYMDVAFISAIWRTPTLPPPDPWLSGQPINYYYFGHYLIALLAKLLGTQPAVAFSIAVALIFALTAAAVYGVAANLVATLSTGRLTRGIVPGALSAVATLVLGNLAGEQVWWASATTLAKGQGAIIANPWQFWLHPNLWTQYDWWSPSRVVNPQSTINEFPAFSFVLADLHAHVFSLPFTALAIGFALNVLLARGQAWEWLRERRFETLLTLACGGVMLGGLFAINGWDLPTYLGLALVALALQQWLAHGKTLNGALARDLVFAAGSLVAVAFLFYLPFYLGYSSPGQGVDFVPGAARSPFGQVMAIFGLPVFLLGTLVTVRLLGGAIRATARRRGPGVAMEQGVILGLLLGVLLLIVLVSANGLWWTLLLGLALAAICGWLAMRSLRADPTTPGRADAAIFVLAGLASLLVAICEVVYLRDVFAGGPDFRMNTVFKLYYQAWLLLGVVVGPVALLLAREARAWLRRLYAPGTAPAEAGKPAGPGVTALPRWLRWAPAGAMLVWLALCAALVLSSVVYPVLAVATRTANLTQPRTLDGLAFAATDGVGSGNCTVVGGGVVTADDAQAIGWLNAHVTGSPVIVEAPGAEYSLCSRVSAFTGLPAVIGWGGHEVQWRTGWLAQGDRNQRFQAQLGAPDAIYTQADQNTVMSLLRNYHVRYLYVGEAERQRYPQADLTRYQTYLPIVYHQGTVTIFEIPERGS